MRYDLALIQARCREGGLPTSLRSKVRLDVMLGKDIVLSVVNAEREADSLIGFEQAGWHFHGDKLFNDAHGHYIEMTYLEIISALIDGQVLIRERWTNGVLKRRELIHRDYNDELSCMEPGDEVRILRSATSGHKP
jgi:hypothetical protein